MKMKNVCECKLVLEDKTFTNEQGNSVEFVEASLVVQGEKFRINFRKEDKALLRFLRRDMQKEEN